MSNNNNSKIVCFRCGADRVIHLDKILIVDEIVENELKT